LVSGKVGVLIIGIGIILAVLVAPRGVLTPQKVTGFVGSFGLPTAQAETPTMVSPKPVSEKLTTQITTTIPTQTPVLARPPPIPFSGQTIDPSLPTREETLDPTVTTPEERALVESEIARLKAEAGISTVTIDPTTGKQSFNIFLRERL